MTSRSSGLSAEPSTEAVTVDGAAPDVGVSVSVSHDGLENLTAAKAAATDAPPVPGPFPSHRRMGMKAMTRR